MQPGYVAPALDGEDFEFFDDLPGQTHGAKPHWRIMQPPQDAVSAVRH
jgi:hypothetical protein